MIPHQDFLAAAAADRIREQRAAAERARDAKLARAKHPKPVQQPGPVHAPTGRCAASAA